MDLQEGTGQDLVLEGLSFVELLFHGLGFGIRMGIGHRCENIKQCIKEILKMNQPEKYFGKGIERYGRLRVPVLIRRFHLP